MKFEKLLEPMNIGSLNLNNRLIVPAMGTNFADDDGYVTDKMINYYTERAKGEFGLIILEICAIEPKGKAMFNQVGLWEDSQIAGMKRLTDSVHKAGGKMLLQLHHAGRQTMPDLINGETPIGPSAVPTPLFPTPNEMSNKEVWDMIDKYGMAALRAKKAGFDGVEVHGGHGYLIAQFMSTHANKRYDEFGGDFSGRMKFPIEVIKRIKETCGDDFPITFRYSHDELVEGGNTIEDATAIARVIEKTGVDALSVTICTYASLPYVTAPAAMPAGYNQHPTSLIKNAVDIPIISVGRYDNLNVAEDVLLSNKADFIAIGRGSIADPHLPKKVREGRLDEIAPCIACLQSCLGYSADPDECEISCLVNPTTGYESEHDFSKVDNSKEVMVIGGGPAGLKAAMTLAERGHQVSLYEKTKHFGGQFRHASIPPTKHEITSMIKYYLNEGKRHGVKYHLDIKVDEEFIKEKKPDEVVIATGGKQIIPDIKGINKANVITCIDALENPDIVQGNVLVIGGGMSGSETADYLAEQGRDVTIVEMEDEIAKDVQDAVKFFLMQRLEDNNVEMHTDSKVIEFLEDGIVYEQYGKTYTLNGFDVIVLAMGVESNDELSNKILNLVDDVHIIGDSYFPAPANKGIERALEVGLKI